MYSVSNNFKTKADNPQIIPYKIFQFPEAGIEFTDKILDMGSFTQQQYEGGELTGTDITVECINDSKEFNYLITDKTYIGQIGRLRIGYNDGPVIEYISRYRGYLDDVEFVTEERPKCRLVFVSKAKRAIERTLGSDAFPLDYSASAYNPADLAWDLLTVRAGLDTTTSTANIDIDYTSWLAYKTICTSLAFSLKAYFTGQSIAEALRLIGELTDTLIYGETDGKYYFRKFIPEVAVTPYLFTTANAHLQGGQLYFNKSRIINKAKTWYGYTPATQVWTGSITKENATSQTNYSLMGREFDNTGVWHNTLNSATNFAERLVDRYREPVETVRFKTKQGTQALLHQMGDLINLTWGQIDYTARLMRIYGISVSLSTGAYELLVEDMTALNYNFLILDSASLGKLDINKLY